MTSVWTEIIKSKTGRIDLDINDDGNSEARLSSDGLGIGAGLSPSANLHIQGNGIVTGDLVVGATAGNSTLEVAGTLGYGLQTVSSNVTLSGNSVVLVDTLSDNISLTLPTASSDQGRIYKIKKNSNSNQLWVAASDNIDGGMGSIEMSAASSGYPYTKLISNGSNWFILSKSNDVSVVIAADNLLGWYKLDETSGNTSTDASGQGNDGVLYTSDLSSFSGDGYIGNGYVGTGSATDNYVALPPEVGIKNRSKYSVSFWAKLNTNHSADLFCETISSANNTVRFVARTYASGNIALITRYDDSTEITLFESSAYSLGEWFHYAVTIDMDNDIHYQYINGQEVASSSESFSGASAFINANADSYLGGPTIGGKPFLSAEINGVIDDVRIYDKALSATEVAALFEVDVP